MNATLAFWFLVLALPPVIFGARTVFSPDRSAAALRAFPRNRALGRILAAVGWFWTAYELDTIGIACFDAFLKVFPGELWLLAAVLTVLTCRWMENLLPVRGVAAVFMLFPAELFPAVRLCETPWRIALVLTAYTCAATGMFAMFYPWHVRRALTALAGRRAALRAAGGFLLAWGGLLLALGALAAGGALN